MIVPLLDLKPQYALLRDEIRRVIDEVCDSQQFIMGPKVDELEREVARYCGCQFAVGVSSGTDALLLSLMASGVRAGDIVITTPYTFFATAGAVARLGARPLFVDIERDTFNIDPSCLEDALKKLDRESANRAKAVIPVHLFGQCADMEPILKIARDWGLIVIEDAAQALGADCRFTDGLLKRAGSMGDCGCFSFFPSKNLGAFGDGGMVTTNSQELYERLKIMRVHGAFPKYYHKIIGGNFRLDAIQAAVLLIKLRHLDEWTSKRQKNAQYYNELLKNTGLIPIELPKVRQGVRHIYNQFVIRAAGARDELRDYLASKGIGCEIYYPVPLHIQECFLYLGYGKNDFPVAMESAETSLAIPVFPELTTEQLAYVVEMISHFFPQEIS